MWEEELANESVKRLSWMQSCICLMLRICLQLCKVFNYSCSENY